MPRRGIAVARRLVRRGLDDLQARLAELRAARVRAPVRICWDLDNTLADTGTLLRDGVALEAAAGLAGPLPGMLELVAAVRDGMPEAEHVVLSARRRDLRAATAAWLRDHEAGLAAGRVLLVPRASDKPRVWRRLAAGGRLVIVDDLTHGHEGPDVASYADLVLQAHAIADAYLGVDDVATVGTSPDAVGAAAARLLAAVGSPVDA